jgi:hypothetical protein
MAVLRDAARVNRSERERWQEVHRESAASALRCTRASDLAAYARITVTALSGGGGAVLVRWHAWPWLALPLAAALTSAAACDVLQRRALDRHRRRCRELAAVLD